ncbi:MAG: hypothetical protein RMJ98_20930 [Myxococcales bacterium]|nr:hypothetical protein [Polyangiaceae bacterium]MDW8251768.1 hypothetical protein [Myxococcales bacterium]
MQDFLLPWLLMALLLAGCKRAEPPRKGHLVTCTCTYLTDFDDTARIDVEVCVPEGLDHQREAAHCALQSAHNHIDGCACKPPGTSCDPSAPNACINR